MLRTILAIVIPVIVWGGLWVGGNAALAAAVPASFTDGGAPRLDATGVFAGIIAFSVVLSLIAGALAARIASGNRMRAVWILAVVQFAIGLAVQASAWAHFPFWYHVLFLGFVIPAHVTGGRLALPKASR